MWRFEEECLCGNLGLKAGVEDSEGCEACDCEWVRFVSVCACGLGSP